MTTAQTAQTAQTTHTAQTSPTAPAAPTSPMRLRELAFGAACAAALRAAARLNVAEALGDAPRTAEELAAAVRTEPKPLRRLLRALSCYGVF
ncbi:MAG: methyltransferase, partial [Streptomyces sp.]|nr:methyltransferase [Streptomyces sp.]